MENTQIKQKSRKRNEKDIVKVAVAYGDGIGPEIMDATLRILDAAGANIKPERIDIGEKVYLSGNSAGIEKSAWETINKNKMITINYI